jgi:hypothetical protein
VLWLWRAPRPGSRRTDTRWVCGVLCCSAPCPLHVHPCGSFAYVRRRPFQFAVHRTSGRYPTFFGRRNAAFYPQEESQRYPCLSHCPSLLCPITPSCSSQLVTGQDCCCRHVWRQHQL